MKNEINKTNTKNHNTGSQGAWIEKMIRNGLNKESGNS